MTAHTAAEVWEYPDELAQVYAWWCDCGAGGDQLVGLRAAVDALAAHLAEAEGAEAKQQGEVASDPLSFARHMADELFPEEPS